MVLVSLWNLKESSDNADIRSEARLVLKLLLELDGVRQVLELQGYYSLFSTNATDVEIADMDLMILTQILNLLDLVVVLNSLNDQLWNPGSHELGPLRLRHFNDILGVFVLTINQLVRVIPLSLNLSLAFVNSFGTQALLSVLLNKRSCQVLILRLASHCGSHGVAHW